MRYVGIDQKLINIMNKMYIPVQKLQLKLKEFILTAKFLK